MSAHTYPALPFTAPASIATDCVLMCLLSLARWQDVWLSSDGTGASWTLQTSAAPMAGFADGALTFMYDSTTAGNGGTAAIATLVLYNSGDNNVSAVPHPTLPPPIATPFHPPLNPSSIRPVSAVLSSSSVRSYRSSDYGKTWTAPIPATFSAGGGVRLVADLRGWLYLLGGSTDGPAVYFSTDVGTTWALVNQQAFNPNVTGAVTVTQSTYGCAALTYRAAATSTTGYHQAIVLYGGTSVLTPPPLHCPATPPLPER